MAGIRANCSVHYFTSLGAVYSVPKYAAALMTEVIQKRGIELHTRLSLSAVDVENRLATFERLDENSQPTGQTKQIQVRLQISVTNYFIFL